MTDQELQKKRFIAAAIDIAIAFGIGVAFAVLGMLLGLVAGRVAGRAGLYLPRVISFLGALVSLGYILARDVLAGGRSFGKQMQNLRVTTTAGEALTFMDSAKRNAIFAIGAALNAVTATLQLVPCAGDAVACVLLPLNILGGLAALAAGILELVKISQDPQGVRLGDQWAGTRVGY